MSKYKQAKLFKNHYDERMKQIYELATELQRLISFLKAELKQVGEYKMEVIRLKVRIEDLEKKQGTERDYAGMNALAAQAIASFSDKKRENNDRRDQR